jgi:hypothetical protein
MAVLAMPVEETEVDKALGLFLQQSLLFIFVGLLLAAAGFAMGVSLSRWMLPLALLSSVAAGWGQPVGRRVAAVALLGLLFVLAVGVSSLIHDDSFDGNAYHLVSVIGLRDGWNPFHDPSFVRWAAASGLYDQSHVDRIANGAIWTDHYPKAAWILAAQVQQWMPRLASASWPQLFFMVLASLSFRQGLRAAGLGPLVATLLGFGAAGSPVMWAQFSTNYVDGLLGSCLLIQVGRLLTAHASQRLAPLAEAGVALLVASNLKFSGMVYAGALLLSFLVVSRPLRQLLWTQWRTQKLTAALALVAAALICWNPYATNLLREGHPFHPLQKINVMEGQADADFLSQGRWAKFWTAGTGLVSPRAADSAAVQPFWAEKPALWRYLDVIKGADVRRQGFGPHFVPTLLLTLLVAGVALSRSRQEQGVAALKALTWAYLLWLAVCTLLNPEFWWARYLPQLWPLPFVVAALAAAMRLRVAALALAVPLGLTTAAFAVCFGLLTRDRLQIEHRLTDLLQHSPEVLAVQDSPRNGRFMFVAAAVALERGARLKPVLPADCAVVVLPSIVACAP